MAQGLWEALAVLYRDFTTQEELDAQYDLTRTVPSVDSYARFYEEESESCAARWSIA